MKSTCIGLKPIGRYYVVQYMMTKDREWLRRLGLKQLKWRPEKFARPEEARLLIGLRRNPLAVFKRPNKRRLVRMLIPLGWNRAKEGTAARCMEFAYAYRLRRVARAR